MSRTPRPTGDGYPEQFNDGYEQIAVTTRPANGRTPRP